MDFITQLKTNHNIILNQQQEQAVLTIDGATLLLAVPGSGKTTVIIARIGNMIYNHSIPPEDILTLTFSVAAARDMQERFNSIFDDEYSNRLQFKTIHSFCNTVIYEYIRSTNGRKFKLLENANQIIKRIYLDINKEYIGEDIIKDITQKIGFCKNMMIEKSEIEKIELPDCDFYEIYNKFEEYKIQNQLMDFDDMLNYAYIILKKRPDLLAKYQSQYKYFNIDEAQDTSFIQHEIIKILAQKNGNIFMVGDEDQSIYGFRAAFPKALLDFKQTYDNATVLLMERNYRSTKKIVFAANRFIKQNKDRFDKNMFCENSEGMEIREIQLSDLKNQYRLICDLLKNETYINNIAILYRNNDSAVPIVDVLDHEKIPFFIRENKPTFFSHFVVIDLLSFIKLSQNPSNIEIFEKIYYKLNCGITKQNFEYFRKNLRENVFQTLLKMPNQSDRFKFAVQELKNQFFLLKGLKPADAIEFIETKMGFSTNLNKMTKKGYSKEMLLQKLNTLKSIAANTDSLNDFIERLSQLENIMQNSGNKENGVTLTTVHSSKGLEFDKVIMVDVIDGQFPSRDSIKLLEEEGDRKLFEEEVRLFYVGITRARNELRIITSKLMNNRSILPSRFVRNLMLPSITQAKVPLPEKVKKSAIIPQSELKKYYTGVRIFHKTFGEGTIEKSKDNIIDVKFKSFGLRKLSLIYCLEKELIQKVMEKNTSNKQNINALREMALQIGNSGENSEMLIEFFMHSDYELRRRACSAAKKLKNREIVKHIIPCLYAEESQIRQYALSAILSSKCTELIDDVKIVLKKEDKEYNRNICNKIISLIN